MERFNKSMSGSASAVVERLSESHFAMGVINALVLKIKLLIIIIGTQVAPMFPERHKQSKILSPKSLLIQRSFYACLCFGYYPLCHQINQENEIGMYQNGMNQHQKK